MRPFLLASLLLAFCGHEPAGQRGPRQDGRSDADPAPELATLTGLYASGSAAASNRLCILAGKRTGRFGLVIRGNGAQSCSGSGRVVRDAAGLRFTMAGDSACSFRATLSGSTIAFPAATPRGCAYYCGGGARLAGARLTQQGATRAAALEARDLVGEPLCVDE